MISQSQPPLPPWETLPTMYDVPSENLEESGLPDEFHFLQPLLLYLTFLPTTWNPERVYSAADLNLYYDVAHPQWYKRPDWFGVVGVSRLYDDRDLRLSYVTWQERVNPFVVVELLSPGTEGEDLGDFGIRNSEFGIRKGEKKETRPASSSPTKWAVYEQILRVPYYVIFSRYTDRLQGFRLEGGHYEPMHLTDGRFAMPELGLSLGTWQGQFRGIDRLWLRWFNWDGELIRHPEEEASLAQQKADAANRRAQRLARALEELGIDLDNLEAGEEN